MKRLPMSVQYRLCESGKLSAIATVVADKRGELVRSGVRAAIIGAPNVGKSSILNYLAGRKAAIVSAIPGTTRDAIEVTLDIAGYKVLF